MNIVRTFALLTLAAAWLLAPSPLQSAPPPAPALPPRTNAPAIRPPGATNAGIGKTANNQPQTNAVAAKKGGTAPAGPGTDWVSKITGNTYFYPGLFALFIIGL